MSSVKEAFDNLLNTIAEETERKFTELDEKLKAKRLAVLESDLAELEKRRVAKLNEDFKEFRPTKA